MQSISKPHIVDLLRIFDKNRWIIPRIRYASVRSKPELIADLSEHFLTEITPGGTLLFLPFGRLYGVPRIEYDLENRRYILDGEVVDVPKRSRQKLMFRISHEPVTLTFHEFAPDPPPQPGDSASSSPLSTHTASDAFPDTPELGTRIQTDETARSVPSWPSGRTRM